jgi:hypothetical protein
MALFNGQTISPGTLHIAEMARKAAEASKKAQGTQETRPGRSLLRIGIEIAAVLVLGFIILSFINPDLTSLTNPTPTPPDPNIPVGRLRFDDFGDVMDELTISMNNIDSPSDGQHLEGWLISDDGTPRNMGPVIIDASGIARLLYRDPEAKNLLETFSQIIITVEEGDVDGNPRPTTPSEEIVYSSIFPPESLVPIRELLAADPDTPNQEALIQGVYYYSAQYVDLMINGDRDVDPDVIPLVQALDNGDEITFRKRTEETINLIVGDASDLYQDYDNDGVIDQYFGDGYGSLPAGDRLGYIQETSLSAKSAVEAQDSTSNIRRYGEDVQACMQSMEDWSNQILTLALRLVDLPMGPEAETIVQSMSDLGKNLLLGTDADENGTIDLIPGECGANIAYDNAYFMADMPIYIGPDRIPPDGK